MPSLFRYNLALRKVNSPKSVIPMGLLLFLSGEADLQKPVFEQ